MALALGDRNHMPAKSLDRLMCIGMVVVDIGATGAPTVNAAQSVHGVTVTRSATGAYDVSLPAVPQAMFVAPVVLQSTTIEYIRGTARNPTAGTMSFQCRAAATPANTDPASGDKIGLLLFGWPQGAG